MSLGAIIEIAWSDRKLEKSCRTDAAGQKRFGSQRWKLLKRRLAALQAAPTLLDMRGIGGFHPLKADRAGSFALDLDGPYRLILQPGHNPVPSLPDGGIDQSAVTRVEIAEVADYHG